MGEKSNDDMTDLMEQVAELYTVLPKESVAIILSRKLLNAEMNHEEETGYDTVHLQESVAINLVDNLEEYGEESLVFYITHGIMDILENSFEELVEKGRDRVASLSTDETMDVNVIRMYDYKNKLH